MALSIFICPPWPAPVEKTAVQAGRTGMLPGPRDPAAAIRTVPHRPGRAILKRQIPPMKSYILTAALLLSACAAPRSTLPATSANSLQPLPPVQQTSLPARLTAAPAGSLPAALQAGASSQLDAGAALPRPSASYGVSQPMSVTTAGAGTAQGDISLNFADTDIRTVVDQILGTILQQNYTIDPTVQGTASLRTVVPLPRDALIPTLQTLLAQDNAVLVQSNGVYRVMPADAAAASPNLAGGNTLGGAVVIPLHYVQAATLAAMLQPYVSATGRLVAVSGENALIVGGDPSSRQALVDLIAAFDVDQLAGQSYELFPVTSGDASDFSTAFSAALGKSSDPSVQGATTVVPLERMNAVLVIARSQNLLADAQRVYAVLNQAQRETVRSWHVYFLHNSRANDAAYVLQQAFTPDNVTAQPTPAATGQISSTFANQSSGSSSSGGSDSNGAGGLLGSSVTSGGSPAGSSGNPAPGGAPATDQSAAGSGASALLGPLSGGSAATPDAIRIIPDNDNNSLLIYATAAEDDRISAMLDQVDITPVEVRIDATIAEVDLDSALQYGTQFFFKSGGINAVLSGGTSAALAANFPGFVLSGHNGDGAPLALSLLQSVTKVDVLSSPELMVMDGQPASLQAGDLVPYLSQTSQSTLTTDSPVINSIDYRETGVILQVTPHVGTDGLVTLDVAQEVSGVEATTTSGIDSPTFSERAVTSRIAVQDGQTIGLAGLISDSDSHGNQGIPYLKNIPLLGDLFATQTNQRTRKELLVMITPHVIRTQSDAAELTADLQQALPNAAGVPAALSTLPY
jgi:general secretion pathway protein D